MDIWDMKPGNAGAYHELRNSGCNFRPGQACWDKVSPSSTLAEVFKNQVELYHQMLLWKRPACYILPEPVYDPTDPTENDPTMWPAYQRATEAQSAARDATRAASLCTEDAMLYETRCAEYYEERRETVFIDACLKHDEYVVEYYAQGYWDMKWEQYDKAVEPDFPGDTCCGVQFFEQLMMKFVRAYRAKEEFLRCTDDRDAHMKCIEAYDIMIDNSVVCTETDCESCVVKNL